MPTGQLSVDIHLATLINTLKVEFHDVALWHCKGLAIPSEACRIVTTVVGCRCCAFRTVMNIPVVRQIHVLPLAIVKVNSLCALHIALVEFPTEIKQCVCRCSQQ